MYQYCEEREKERMSMDTGELSNLTGEHLVRGGGYPLAKLLKGLEMSYGIDVSFY